MAEQAPDEKATTEKTAAYIEKERKSLVRMFKDGIESYVHPSCVKSHKEAGWTEAAAV